VVAEVDREGAVTFGVGATSACRTRVVRTINPIRPMKVQTRVLAMAFALLTTAVIGACGRSAPPPATPPEPAVDTAALRRAREDSLRIATEARMAAEAARLRRLAQDSIDRARAAEEAARRDSDMLRSVVTTTINFDYDKSDLRDDAKASLDAKIPILLTNSNVTIRIAGHADNRGSSEYNLALGQRRAAAAKRYLVERGVAEGRIETTSFGEERPACTEDNDGCWGQNRRDEFEITAGGPMLTRPRS
jgi:peptidoglycan-associated lipoprotein